MSYLLQRLRQAMEWPDKYELSKRELRIITHYERQMAKGMSENTAYERAYSDLHGNNGHASKPQRAKKKLAVTVNVVRGERQ